MNKKEMVANKRGISSIIATLILLLLTIVLVGIVWAVVSGIVKTSSQGVTTGAQCTSSAVDIKSATCTQAGSCNVTIQRTLGTDTIGGLRVLFYNAAGVSNFTDINGTITTLDSVRMNNVPMGIVNVTEVDAAIYFINGADKSPCTPVKYTTVVLE